MAIGAYERSFMDWAKRDPKRCLDYIKEAKQILNEATKAIKAMEQK